MPNTGLGTGSSSTADPAVGAQNSGFDFTFTTSITDPTTVVVPLVVDNPVQTTVTGAPLSVWQKESLNLTQAFNWRLRRIVGKLFVSAGFTVPDPQTDVPADAVLISAGIIVRRVDEEAGQPVVLSQDVNSIENNSDPWIWRRDWILGRGGGADNFGGTTLNINGLRSFPKTNADFGSVRDGPHVDQKTNRVIAQEERLFLNITANQLPLATADRTAITVNPVVYLNFQYRIVGTVFTNSGNRKNASR